MRKYQKGDKVIIHNFTPSGKKFFEGIATILREKENGFYLVKFQNGDVCSRTPTCLANDEISKVICPYCGQSITHYINHVKQWHPEIWKKVKIYEIRLKKKQ